MKLLLRKSLRLADVLCDPMKPIEVQDHGQAKRTRARSAIQRRGRRISPVFARLGDESDRDDGREPQNAHCRPRYQHHVRLRPGVHHPLGRSNRRWPKPPSCSRFNAAWVNTSDRSYPRSSATANTASSTSSRSSMEPDSK